MSDLNKIQKALKSMEQAEASMIQANKAYYRAKKQLESSLSPSAPSLNISKSVERRAAKMYKKFA